MKSNKGAAGIDDQTIEDFEREPEEEPVQGLESDVVGQLLSATGADGEDPESNGGKRALGIPTVSDRIAQMVVKNRMEPLVDPLFHRRFLRVSPGEVGVGCSGMGAADVLGLSTGSATWTSRASSTISTTN